VPAETTKLRRPCTNCPWRVDAPRDYWDPQHFVSICQTMKISSTHGNDCAMRSMLQAVREIDFSKALLQ
jgi:hypothetical protein